MDIWKSLYRIEGLGNVQQKFNPGAILSHSFNVDCNVKSLILKNKPELDPN